MNIIVGSVFNYGDDVNTDVIFPGKYTYTVNDADEMAKHALEDLDERFVHEVQEGDVIVAGKNFGCGSSREQAVSCLKAAGIRAVVAVSFARIYFRNAINQGLLTITLPADVIELLHRGDQVRIDVESGVLHHNGQEYDFPPLDAEVMRIVEVGGLVPYVQQRVVSMGE